MNYQTKVTHPRAKFIWRIEGHVLYIMDQGHRELIPHRPLSEDLANCLTEVAVELIPDGKNLFDYVLLLCDRKNCWFQIRIRTGSDKGLEHYASALRMSYEVQSKYVTCSLTPIGASSFSQAMAVASHYHRRLTDTGHYVTNSIKT